MLKVLALARILSLEKAEFQLPAEGCWLKMIKHNLIDQTSLLGLFENLQLFADKSRGVCSES